MATVTAPAGRPKVLLLGRIELAHAAWAAIADAADVVVVPPSPPPSTASTTDESDNNRARFLAACRSGALDGCVVAYRTFSSAASTTGPVDAALVAALPASLRFICHNGAGYDQIDVAACTARGIRVSHVRGAVDDATADCALFLLLGALRNFNAGMATLRRGGWHHHQDQQDGQQDQQLINKGRDPRGKTLGILGMGGIGRNLARKARVFGMTIKYHNRTRLGPELEDGAEYCGFEELLGQSDVLSLHLPLNVCLPPPRPFSYQQLAHSSKFGYKKREGVYFLMSHKNSHIPGT